MFPVSSNRTVELSRARRNCFILSTSSDRDSHEWERFQAGILSHELRSALRGAADANLDGVVTYRELGAFLVRANQAIVNRRYRPDFMVRPPSNEFRTELLAWKDRDASGLLRIEAVKELLVAGLEKLTKKAMTASYEGTKSVTFKVGQTEINMKEGRIELNATQTIVIKTNSENKQGSSTSTQN